MKTKQLVLKIISCVCSALLILPLFLNFIGYRTSSGRVYYTYQQYGIMIDTLIVISRVLYIMSLVLAMILLVAIIIQLFFKHEVIDWIVIGASILLVITASLCFISALLYCVKVSSNGAGVILFPAFGCYAILFLGLATPILALLSNRKENNQNNKNTENKQ